jgi:hypothetical protein
MQANNTTTQKNRVYAPIIIGSVLLISIFALYPLYTSYVDTSIEIVTLKKIQSEKTTKIDAIKKMQALFAGSGSNDIKARVEKYKNKFNTSDIMETVMVNKYTKDTTLSPASIIIGNIDVEPGRKLPSGLSLGTVSLSLSASTPDQIIEYITYLTTESRLAFTIDSISLPIDTAIIAPTDAGVSLAITLGVYYYE